MSKTKPDKLLFIGFDKPIGRNEQITSDVVLVWNDRFGSEFKVVKDRINEDTVGRILSIIEVFDLYL